MVIKLLAGLRYQVMPKDIVRRRIDIAGKGRENEVIKWQKKEHHNEEVLNCVCIGRSRCKGVPKDTYTYQIETRAMSLLEVVQLVRG